MPESPEKTSILASGVGHTTRNVNFTKMISTSSGNAASIAITLCGLAISSDCVFDTSLVPETCPDRFVDLKGLINKFMESSLGDRPCRYLVPQGFVHLAHQRVARKGFLKKETLLQILFVTFVVFKIARHVNGLHIRSQKF